MTISEEDKKSVEEERKQSFTTKRATVEDLENSLFTIYPVLDHGLVRVIDYMGDDNAIVQAARVSYGAGTKKAQDDNSYFGKVLSISLDDGSYEIISKGHRNPQGLAVTKNSNFLVETEHGPVGGDEVNIIEVGKNQNFGWPISSYGEHYGGKNAPETKNKYEKYPLHKSHSEHGFIEPLKYFNPSIGISQIIGLDNENKYVVASLKAHLFLFLIIDPVQVV